MTAWLTKRQAAGLACPSAPRQCVTDQCAAWMAAPDRAGAGRCLWHLRASQIGRLAGLIAVGQRLIAPVADSAVAAPLFLALDYTDRAIDASTNALARVILAGSKIGPKMLAAEIRGETGQEGAPQGARGVGRSPAGGVSNTPPAKCTRSSNPAESQGADPGDALPRDTPIGSRGPLGPAPIVDGRRLAPRPLEQGEWAADGHGRRVMVLEDLDTLAGRRRVKVRGMDGIEREAWFDSLRRPPRERSAPVGDVAPSVRAPDPVVPTFEPGDAVVIVGVRGAELDGEVVERKAPAYDGSPAYYVRTARGVLPVAAADLRSRV